MTQTPFTISGCAVSPCDNPNHYVVITPVRNEEQYIESTIASMVSQEIKPCEWIIVDDGSSDGTGQIIDRYAQQYPWIKPLHRPDRGFRHAGTGVMEAFQEGYKALTCKIWQYIVKMDGDLQFERSYFRQCFAHFTENSHLGIGGGYIYYQKNGVAYREKNPLFHVRGATKIYRRKCWEAIEPLLCSPGWDTVDEVKANMLGWETRSFPDVKLLHLRHTGTADGIWKNRIKGGTIRYIIGYHPLFLITKSIRMLFQKPYIFGSLAFLYGYMNSYFRNVPRVVDDSFIRYLRSQQLKKLLGQNSIWN